MIRALLCRLSIFQKTIPTDSGSPVGMPCNFQNAERWFGMCFLSSHAELDSASLVRGFAIWLAFDQRITPYRFWISHRDGFGKVHNDYGVVGIVTK